ncbi:hypothetical protein DY000_02041504 [Brassica cretica]|uniref:Uncharacterized protein n=1 Tax=Brassica cretica TaxID=69181 RepID=A0ABQ7BC56_BRACR|nr:hypothetical protein DY000_02041504 [Brassica cretica]
MPHDDALVITLELAGTIFMKILVDTESTVNVDPQKTLRSISQPTQTSLVTPDEGGPFGLSSMLEGFISNRQKNHTRELETATSLLDDRILKDASARRERLTRP